MSYALYGASVGALVGVCNFSFLFLLAKDPSVYIFYMFLVYFPSFVVSLPWSLISIFTEGNILIATVMTIGATLNGALIGAACFALKKSD